MLAFQREFRCFCILMFKEMKLLNLWREFGATIQIAPCLSIAIITYLANASLAFHVDLAQKGCKCSSSKFYHSYHVYQCPQGLALSVLLFKKKPDFTNFTNRYNTGWYIGSFFFPFRLRHIMAEPAVCQKSPGVSFTASIPVKLGLCVKGKKKIVTIKLKVKA